LNPAPHRAIWKNQGSVAFGKTLKETQIITDIGEHTDKSIRYAEKLDAWIALPEKDLFEMEYWELEQAKLKKSSNSPLFEGKIAIVTGAASGIGKATVEAFLHKGAVVAALDLKPEVEKMFGKNVLGIACDLTSESEVEAAIRKTVAAFGGLDILVSNAGYFPSSALLENLDSETWEKSLSVNLTSHRLLMKAAIPFLKHGIDPVIVMNASKNVAAPGPGAGAYSVAKAGQNQLGRLAALELGTYGIRVQIVHPNAVFDTGIWTEEVLKKRADSYGLSVEAYKANNVLRIEVQSADVAAAICAVAGTDFLKSTGLQITVDGGNERVI
jgi:NAD(P)-dependent dehydrogenase (short-subunit alcohol dehydrogenase family)